MKEHILIYALSTIVLCGLMANLKAQEQLQDTIVELYPATVTAQLHHSFAWDTLSADDLEQSGGLAQALASRLPVNLKDNGPGNIITLAMRGGSAQQTSAFWNGMPINSPSLGLLDLSLIPSIFLSDAGLSYGASQLYEGNGGVGGAIHLQSRAKYGAKRLFIKTELDPVLAGSSTDLAYTSSKASMASRTALHRYSAVNAFPYRYEARGELQEEIRSNAAVERMGLSQDFNWRLPSDVPSDISLSMNGLSMKRELPGLIGITARDERQEDEVFRALVAFRRAGDKLVHRFSMGLSDEVQVYDAPAFSIHSKIHNQSGQFAYKANWAGPKDAVLLRADHMHARSRVQSGDRHSLDVTGLFVQWERALPSADLRLSGRSEMANGDFRPLTASVSMVQYLDEAREVSFKGALSRNYRAPTLNDLYWPELGNDGLLPEQGYSAELGLQIDYGSSQLRAQAYRTHTEQLLVWLPGDDGRFRPVNEDRGQSQGLELSIRAALSKSWRIMGSYNYLEASVTRSESSDWVESIYQPKHQAVFSLDRKVNGLECWLRYSARAAVRYDYVERHLSSRLAPVQKVDMGFRWTPLEELPIHLSLTADNITDSDIQYVKDLPTPGRRLIIHLILDLHEPS